MSNAVFLHVFFYILVCSGLLSVSVSLDSFCVFSLRPKYLHPFAQPSLPHSRSAPGLGLALVSTDLWYQRQSRVHMDQKSRSKFLPWPGLEPRTSRVAIQHATARLPYTKNFCTFIESSQCPVVRFMNVIALCFKTKFNDDRFISAKH